MSGILSSLKVFKTLFRPSAKYHPIKVSDSVDNYLSKFKLAKLSHIFISYSKNAPMFLTINRALFELNAIKPNEEAKDAVYCDDKSRDVLLLKIGEEVRTNELERFKSEMEDMKKSELVKTAVGLFLERDRVREEMFLKDEREN